MRKPSDEIIDSLIGLDRPNPLYKVYCHVGKHYPLLRDMNEAEGMCNDCYEILCDKAEERAQERTECLISMGN